VNVSVKFYSIEGATIYDAAYSVNLEVKVTNRSITELAVFATYQRQKTML